MAPRKNSLTASIFASFAFANALRIAGNSAEAVIGVIIGTSDFESAVKASPADIENFLKAIKEVANYPTTFALSDSTIDILLDLIRYANQDEVTSEFVAGVVGSPILEDLLNESLANAVHSANTVALPGSLDDAEDDAEDEGEDDTPAEIPVIPVMDGVQSVQSNLI